MKIFMYITFAAKLTQFNPPILLNKGISNDTLSFFVTIVQTLCSLWLVFFKINHKGHNVFDKDHKDFIF